MKKSIRLLKFINLTLILLGVFLFYNCSTSSYNVHHITEFDTIPHSKNGIYYSLPRNVITIDVTVKKNEYHKGQYSEFAGKYLGINNCININSFNYSIDNISISSYSEKDPEQIYYIEFDKHFPSKNSPFFLNLNNSGLIHSINNTIDKSAINEQISEIETTSNSKETSEYKYITDDNLIVRIDTIIKKIEITDSITIEKKILKRIMVEKTIEQKAKEAADFLLKIKEEKFHSITGYAEVNYEKGAIEYMDNKLDELEDKYLKLFTGHTTTKTIKFRFNYTPDKNNPLGLAPLFKFSSKKGILPNSSKKGDFVYIKLNRNKDTKLIQNSITKNSSSKEKNGIFYRIPEFAKITIRQGNIKKAETRLLINQFGVVASLPAKNTKIEFYPNSGSIKNVEFK